MLHQDATSSNSWFITLTYADESLMVRNGVANLVPSDLRKFWKRLRINLVRSGISTNLKYYACGEYGENETKTKRPHYHAIVFDLPIFDPKQIIKETWGHGLVHVGTVTADSIRYVAQYIDKKLLGTTSYFTDLEQPFQVASQGLGIDWLKGNLERVLYDASLNFRGKKYPIPKLYRSKIMQLFPDAAEGVNQRTLEAAIINQIDFILELAPQFGGRAYSELTFEERCELGDLICKRGEDVELDLKAGAAFRARQKEKKL